MNEKKNVYNRQLLTTSSNILLVFILWAKNIVHDHIHFVRRILLPFMSQCDIPNGFSYYWLLLITKLLLWLIIHMPLHCVGSVFFFYWQEISSLSCWDIPRDSVSWIRKSWYHYVGSTALLVNWISCLLILEHPL